MAASEIEISDDGTEHAYVAFDKIMDAIAAASDQDRCTWVLTDGKRVAYIATVDVGEANEQALDDLLHTRLAGEWRDVGPTEGGVRLQLDLPSSRDPEGQR